MTRHPQRTTAPQSRQPAESGPAKQPARSGPPRTRAGAGPPIPKEATGGAAGGSGGPHLPGQAFPLLYASRRGGHRPTARSGGRNDGMNTLRRPAFPAVPAAGGTSHAATRGEQSRQVQASHPSTASTRQANRAPACAPLGVLCWPRGYAHPAANRPSCPRKDRGTEVVISPHPRAIRLPPTRSRMLGTAHPDPVSICQAVTAHRVPAVRSSAANRAQACATLLLGTKRAPGPQSAGAQAAEGLMPLHIVVKLPDGRHVWADYRDPIVPAMRRYLQAVCVTHTDPRARDVADIGAWLETHATQSAACEDYCYSRTRTCGHDLPDVSAPVRAERERAAITSGCTGDGRDDDDRGSPDNEGSL